MAIHLALFLFFFFLLTDGIDSSAGDEITLIRRRATVKKKCLRSCLRYRRAIREEKWHWTMEESVHKQSTCDREGEEGEYGAWPFQNSTIDVRNARCLKTLFEQTACYTSSSLLPYDLSCVCGPFGSFPEDFIYFLVLSSSSSVWNLLLGLKLLERNTREDEELLVLLSPYMFQSETRYTNLKRGGGGGYMYMYTTRAYELFYIYTLYYPFREIRAVLAG